MLEDTFESMEDQDELEDAAQEEVDKILFEVTSGMINALSSSPVSIHSRQNLFEVTRDGGEGDVIFTRETERVR